MIITDRLRLRSWTRDDVADLAKINADPEVGYWLGGPFSTVQTREQIAALDRHDREHHFTFWALEELQTGKLIGTCGLKKIAPDLPVRPGVEIGWRLARPCWGKGYAIEAASATLEHAWRTGHPEVLAFTAQDNARSRTVMERLGMRREPDCDFDHPRLSPDHPLRTHVVYSIGKPS